MRRQRIWMVLPLALWLSGCIPQTPYDLNSAVKKQLDIASDAMHMANQQLTIVTPSKYEKAWIVYYAQSEWELARILQYAIDCSQTTITYQSPQALDLKLTAHLLSIVNPFDISLIQNEIDYTDQNGTKLYCSKQITIKCLDHRHEQACQEAKRRVDAIIDEHMSIEEKITAIHDDIIAHCVYETSAQSQTESADRSVYHASGVLLDGRGVCAGYSRAFMIMAQYAGIDAVYVSSETMNHGWNYVYDGKQWRFIDVTWDDPLPDQGAYGRTTYLCLDHQSFFADGRHTLSEEERSRIEQVAASFFPNDIGRE